MRRDEGSDLARLCPLIDGAVDEDRLVGRYRGFAVEAQPARENPAPEMSTGQGGTRQPGRRIDIFKLRLAGVAGWHPWDCRSEPTLLANLALVLPARLVFPLIPTAFGFHRSRLEWFAKKVGVPAAEGELQERLRSSGLFDELAALRWGSNPYLPRAAFNPRAQAIAGEHLAAFAASLQDAVRAQGRLGHERALGEQLAGAVRRQPGELSLQVESGVPSEERFQQLLDRALRIARINEEQNTANVDETSRSATTERRAT
jgi:hypothetical protein